MTGDGQRRPRGLRERSIGEDAGTTLVELLVGMVVMGIFMAICTGAVVGMAHTVAEVEAVTSSATQVDRAFLELDKLVRYADAITPVDEPRPGSWYVVLETGRDATAAAGHRCTQLRVDDRGMLQVREWEFMRAPNGPPPWRTLASDIRTDGDPFMTPPVGKGAVASTRYQQLTVTLRAGTARTGSSSTSNAAMTFTALNSSVSDPSNGVGCQPAPRWTS